MLLDIAKEYGIILFDLAQSVTYNNNYIHKNLSILLVNKRNNQMRHDQPIGTTSFMVKWYEVGTITMCYTSWEAWTNTENTLFCFQNMGPGSIHCIS